MIDTSDPFTTLLTTAQAADLAGVSTATVRQWASRGHLTAHGRDDHGRALYLLIDVAKAEHATRKVARRKVAA